jgi:hypothetical protein
VTSTPPARSPERERLHEAIVYARECAERIERLKAARDTVVPWRIAGELDGKRERLTELEEEARRHAYEAAIGDTTTAPPPVERISAEIALAERGLETARAVRKRIDDELGGLERSQPFRVATVRDRARAVLAAELPQSKAVLELLAELAETRVRLLQLSRSTWWLAEQGVIPKRYGVADTIWWPPAKWDEPVEADGRWQAALDALLADADAVLPG